MGNKTIRRLQLALSCFLALLVVGGTVLPPATVWQCRHAVRVVALLPAAGPAVMPCRDALPHGRRAHAADGLLPPRSFGRRATCACPARAFAACLRPRCHAPGGAACGSFASRAKRHAPRLCSRPRMVSPAPHALFLPAAPCVPAAAPAAGCRPACARCAARSRLARSACCLTPPLLRPVAFTVPHPLSAFIFFVLALPGKCARLRGPLVQGCKFLGGTGRVPAPVPANRITPCPTPRHFSNQQKHISRLRWACSPPRLPARKAARWPRCPA